MPDIVLEAGTARAVVCPEAGGRLGSLTIGGAERLVTGSPSDDPMSWGSYPMAPWAGRIRRGRFRFDGTEYQLPVNLAPHAIHGTVFDRPWSVEPDGALVCTLGDRWPFGGFARQTFTLDPTSMACRLEVHAERSMPASTGYHPWFRRPVELTVEPASMYQRDDEGIPTGELVAPSPLPWDDCFVDLAGPAVLTWPDGLAVTVASEATHWVVYTPDHAVCVEPQSGPPDALTLAPVIVEPGAPLVVTLALTWAKPSGSPATDG